MNQDNVKKIILDRSIFHGKRYDDIKNSALLSLVTRNLIEVYYTSTFIEETLMFATCNPELFLDQWRFIVSLNNRYWFKTAEQIIPIELGRKSHRFDYYFLMQEKIHRVIDNAPKLARKDIPKTVVDAVLHEINENYNIRKNHRAIRLQMRAEVPKKDYDFDKYVENNVEWFIEEYLMRYHKNSDGYLKVWREHKSELMFSDKFIRSWFSAIFIPIVDHQIKVDKNDKVDAEQLAFLEWADIFVSDDIGFPQRALNLLFPSGEKAFMTSVDLYTYLESIA
jgi:hypothetical protein